MTKRIVHIGFPKTATTYLQWEVFPFLEDVNYVDYNACREIFPQIISTDSLDHDLASLESKMNKYEKEDQLNLYSFESLSGSPYAFKGMNRSLIADSLKEVGFEKVIITVREQSKAIDSYYRQYIVHGGTLRFDKWLDIENKRPWLHKHFSLSYLKYDGLVEHYQKLFGVENVLVMNSSDFKSSESTFLNTICEFVGSGGKSSDKEDNKSVNDSLSNLSTELLRICNYFTYNTIRPSQFIHSSISTRNFWLLFRLILDPYLIRFFSSAKSYVERKGLKQKLQDYYADSNNELVKLCSVKFR